jgi:hypothetical protein
MLEQHFQYTQVYLPNATAAAEAGSCVVGDAIDIVLGSNLSCDTEYPD